MSSYINSFISILFLIMNVNNGFSQSTRIIEIDVFSIKLPSDLKSLSQKDIELKYTSQGEIPDVVYQGENDWVNICYKKTNLPIDDNQLEIFKINIESQFLRPNYEILKNDVIEINNKNFILTKVFLKNENVLMSNLVTAVNGKLVIVIISHSTNRSNYKSENEMIIQSLKCSES